MVDGPRGEVVAEPRGEVARGGARAWLQAARPLAHVNIALPLIYGQAFAHVLTRSFSWKWFLVAQLYGVLNHLFIVFANDYADRDADALNTAPTLVSGGSRVLPEGKLSPAALLHGAWVSWTLMLSIAAGSAWFGRRWDLVPLVAVAGVLMHAYSFRPLRLSYRGHGEWLQALGTGAVLPAIGYVMQAGSLARMPWPAMLGPVCIGLAGNVLTALPDTAFDRAAGKRTLPVRWGEFRARITALVYMFLAAIGPLMGHRDMREEWFLITPAVAIALLLSAVVLVRRADSSDRKRCLAFVFLTAGAGHVLLLGWSISLSRF